MEASEALRLAPFAVSPAGGVSILWGMAQATVRSRLASHSAMTLSGQATARAERFTGRGNCPLRINS